MWFIEIIGLIAVFLIVVAVALLASGIAKVEWKFTDD